MRRLALRALRPPAAGGPAIALAWLLDRSLRRRRRELAIYRELHGRLDGVERALSEAPAPASSDAKEPGGACSVEPAVALPRPAPPRSARRIIYRTVTLKNGARYDVAIDPRRMDPITWATASGAPWFLDDYYVLLDRMRPGDAVLDLGGHVGTFALAAAALDCKVACVEAAPENVALLHASVVRNGFDDLWIAWGAVTDREGTVAFLPHGPWGTVANPTVLRSPEAINAREVVPVRVPALTGAGILRWLGWDRVDFIKLDVEGSEIAALNSMAALLVRPDAPTLLYESNPQTLAFFGETPERLSAILRGFGYESYLMTPSGLTRVRPDDLPGGYAVNCLAVKGSPASCRAAAAAAP